MTDAVFTHPYHPTLMGTDTIHHDAVHASCILLPVVANGYVSLAPGPRSHSPTPTITLIRRQVAFN